MKRYELVSVIGMIIWGIWGIDDFIWILYNFYNNNISPGEATHHFLWAFPIICLIMGAVSVIVLAIIPMVFNVLNKEV